MSSFFKPIALISLFFSLSMGYICDSTYTLTSATLKTYTGGSVATLKLAKTENLGKNFDLIPKQPLLNYAFASTFTSACNDYALKTISWTKRDTGDAAFSMVQSDRYVRFFDSISISGVPRLNVFLFKNSLTTGVNQTITWDAQKNQVGAYYGSLIMYDSVFSPGGTFTRLDVTGYSSASYADSATFWDYIGKASFQSANGKSAFTVYAVKTNYNEANSPIIKASQSPYINAKSSLSWKNTNTISAFDMRGKAMNQGNHAQSIVVAPK